mgnify:CR=1 FL=1
MERVVLAFSREETAQKIKHMLEGTGYEVCSVCRSGSELLRYTAELDAALVIMGYKLGGILADDIIADLPPGIKLMSIVKAENQDMIESDEIFVLHPSKFFWALLTSARKHTGIRRKKKL